MRREAAYILRLWCDSEHNEYWRASLENLRTREHKAFADLGKLSDFLNEQTSPIDLSINLDLETTQTPCKRTPPKV